MVGHDRRLTRDAGTPTFPGMGDERGSVVERLTALRQYQASGERAPHKPLLVLLALGQLARTGSSELTWSAAEERLVALLREFGTPSSTGPQAAAYPFTRLRGDGVWRLSRDVPNDSLGPLREAPIAGSFTDDIERALTRSPDTIYMAARAIVLAQFPMSIAPDVLAAAGFEPDLDTAVLVPAAERRRSGLWRQQVVMAWDRACAFCGFDGSLAGMPVGIEAAHVRWFNFGGPDELDNGLALCSLHHKLLDRGVLGLSDPETIAVSQAYAAVSEPGKRIYDLHGARLRPRPGTSVPSIEHVAWHRAQVFKGEPLSPVHA